jgi:hypothetical protein
VERGDRHNLRYVRYLFTSLEFNCGSWCVRALAIIVIPSYQRPGQAIMGLLGAFAFPRLVNGNNGSDGSADPRAHGALVMGMLAFSPARPLSPPGSRARSLARITPYSRCIH